STAQIQADIDNNVGLLTDHNGNIPVGSNPQQPPNNPVVRNFERWHILGTYVWPNAYIGKSWADEVTHLSNFMSTRLAWIDSQYLPNPQFSQSGGTLTQPFQLSISGPAVGTIYYTTDGSDPRLSGGAINPNAIAYTGPITIAD